MSCWVGISFVVPPSFLIPDTDRADTRHNYGENHCQLFRMIEGRAFVVVYTPRPNATRIISASKANKREVAFNEMGTNQN